MKLPDNYKDFWNFNFTQPTLFSIDLLEEDEKKIKELKGKTTLLHGIAQKYKHIKTTIRYKDKGQVEDVPLEEFLNHPEGKLNALRIVDQELLDLFTFPAQWMDDWLEFIEEADFVVMLSQQYAYTAPHVDYYGVGTVIQVLDGIKEFSFWKPTTTNISIDDDLLGLALPRCDLQLHVTPGTILYIPAGWRHSVSTKVDTVCIARSFWNALQLNNSMNVIYAEEIS